MKKTVKRSIGYITIGIFAFIQSALAQANKKQQAATDTSLCLELIGKLDGTVKDFEGNYTAKLIKGNKVVEQQTLPVKKSFTFTMRRNMLYTIKIEKAGYIYEYFYQIAKQSRN